MKSITLHPIGTIRTPHKTLEGTPIQPPGARGIRGTIEVDTVFQEGLLDLKGFSHIYLLYLLHLSKGYCMTVKPFLDDALHGVFSTRAPRRPNPIGLSLIRLIDVIEGTLYVEDVDMVDGTPLLDIKPYVPDFDQPCGDICTGWYSGRSQNVKCARADKRFI